MNEACVVLLGCDHFAGEHLVLPLRSKLQLALQPRQAIRHSAGERPRLGAEGKPFKIWESTLRIPETELFEVTFKTSTATLEIVDMMTKSGYFPHHVPSKTVAFRLLLALDPNSCFSFANLSEANFCRA